MAGGKGKIHEHPNAGKNGLQKNPQNINRKGRPKKSFSSFNDIFKKKGVTPLTKRELLECYGIIFNLPETELEKIVKDPEYPFILRMMILELKDRNKRDKAWRDYRDYMFGKAPVRSGQEEGEGGEDISSPLGVWGKFFNK